MRKSVSTVSEVLNFSVEDVWNTITDNKNWQWRNDLQNIKILNDNEFVEYGKGGLEIRFNITRKEKFKVYQFTMNSKYFSGEWTGYFEKLSDERTRITFTESIIYKNLFLKFFSSLFINLKAIQEKYIRDLKKKLSETS
ncbi:DUF3284 domain-containing protein [Thermophagus sp. OGC60D27]|uniref:DUF3284 domain-containing protein n=1 Tax=Thermophagus sp. OGC60D27 TaxID=3458415 RepID=UPI004037EC61